MAEATEQDYKMNKIVARCLDTSIVTPLSIIPNFLVTTTTIGVASSRILKEMSSKNNMYHKFRKVENYMSSQMNVNVTTKIHIQNWTCFINNYSCSSTEISTKWLWVWSKIESFSIICCEFVSGNNNHIFSFNDNTSTNPIQCVRDFYDKGNFTEAGQTNEKISRRRICKYIDIFQLETL